MLIWCFPSGWGHGLRSNGGGYFVFVHFIYSLFPLPCQELSFPPFYLMPLDQGGLKTKLESSCFGTNDMWLDQISHIKVSNKPSFINLSILLISFTTQGFGVEKHLKTHLWHAEDSPHLNLQPAALGWSGNVIQTWYDTISKQHQTWWQWDLKIG